MSFLFHLVPQCHSNDLTWPRFAGAHARAHTHTEPRVVLERVVQIKFAAKLSVSTKVKGQNSHWSCISRGPRAFRVSCTLTIFHMIRQHVFFGSTSTHLKMPCFFVLLKSTCPDSGNSWRFCLDHRHQTLDAWTHSCCRVFTHGWRDNAVIHHRMMHGP